MPKSENTQTAFLAEHVLKTTMIVESHWRKLKHDYLHKFNNRPQIDLVVWVLHIPGSLVRMRALLGKITAGR
jgi:hypothetical protein